MYHQAKGALEIFVSECLFSSETTLRNEFQFCRTGKWQIL